MERRTELITQVVIGQYTDWIKRFDVNEYIQNPPFIEKLYEEKQLALVNSIELQKELKNQEAKCNELNLENQKLKMKLLETNKRSYYSFSLSLLSTVLVGIGVNLVTSNQQAWTGWVMISAALIISMIAFLLRPESKL